MATAYPTIQQSASATGAATPATEITGQELRRSTVIAYLVLSIVIALSTLLPWMNLWFVQVSGLQLGVVGWAVLLTGGYSAFAAGRSLSQGRAVRGLRGTQIGAAVIGLGAVAQVYAGINEACQETLMASDTGSCTAAFLGNGAKLALFASIGLGLTALFRRPTK
jgi:hypothetical protein